MPPEGAEQLLGPMARHKQPLRQAYDERRRVVHPWIVHRGSSFRSHTGKPASILGSSAGFPQTIPGPDDVTRRPRVRGRGFSEVGASVARRCVVLRCALSQLGRIYNYRIEPTPHKDRPSPQRGNVVILILALLAALFAGAALTL